ncbi:MAG: cobalamin-binding protein [Deltaproteobacteria bacterium]|nr:MAG: cobalamin-binding protein [Deltaproteobacteria bacterium]
MSLEELNKLVETGETEASETAARALLAQGADPLEILDSLTKTMERVGNLFADLEIFLPEVMMAGEALTAVVNIVKPELQNTSGEPARGKVVIGVVKGDLHEIGKNIVKLMLETNGFEVKDLGYDVDPLDFIKAAEEMGADFIGASSLMTTTIPRQKEIIAFLKDKGLRDKYKVVIGGAPTSQMWADMIGADLYCEDANCAAAKMAAMLDEKTA